jgi:hypothetical protein
MQEHSKLGIASFVISIINIALFVIFCIADITIRLTLIGGFYYVFIGVGGGLGINGLMAKNKKKTFAVLGVILSVAIFFIALGVTI